MATWPATLPAPSAFGYGYSLADPVARSPFDSGRLQARARSLAPPSRVPVTWVLTEAEMAVFEAWFRHEALDGAAWFSTPLANGQGVTNVDAQFAEDWQATATASGYSVSASLQVRALPLA